MINIVIYILLGIIIIFTLSKYISYRKNRKRKLSYEDIDKEIIQILNEKRV